MEEWLSRTSLLLGNNTLPRLQNAHILIVGVGGVGAYAAEMIARSGVGEITIIDADTVAVSNINRQLIALHSTIDKAKVEVLHDRLLDINPALRLHVKQCYLEASAVDTLLDNGYDFVIDAIDTIAPKIALLTACIHRKIRVISSMGAGARLDPTAIAYADIADTYHCGLAREVRRRLKAAGITRGLKVVFSTEQPSATAVIPTTGERNKRSTVGTISYIPAIFGCYLAAYVIRKLSENDRDKKHT